MNVDFEYSDNGWEITQPAIEIFKDVKDKRDYLQKAFISLHSKINVLIKHEQLSPNADTCVVVEKNYPMLKQQVVIVAFANVIEAFMNKSMVVHVDFHMMTVEEYGDSFHAND